MSAQNEVCGRGEIGRSFSLKSGEVEVMFSEGLQKKYNALYNIYEQVIITITDYEDYQGYTLSDNMKTRLDNFKKLIEEELEKIVETNNSLLN